MPAPSAPLTSDQSDGHAHPAAIAQLGERQTEDLKVPGSIPGRGIVSVLEKSAVVEDANARFRKIIQYIFIAYLYCIIL